jgi:chromosome segregation ATPase
LIAIDNLLQMLQLREQELIELVKDRDVHIKQLAPIVSRVASTDEIIQQRDHLSLTVTELRQQIQVLQDDIKLTETKFDTQDQAIRQLQSLLDDAHHSNESNKKEIHEIDKENQELDKLCNSLEREKRLYSKQVIGFIN